jgi:hypothetical protein
MGAPAWDVTSVSLAGKNVLGELWRLTAQQPAR